MTPYLSTNAAVAGELLAEAPPVITGAAATGIVHALGLTGPRIPDWITDPNLRADIAAGYMELSDDLAGGAR
ncbi:hypothetical protein [Streptomyces sp. NPDC058653]|uniref:hypothetical protein n=1 Tax=Streptomyces sp. NPDC058653 TaxID=3346576 RepID=UPI0036514BF3